MKRILFVAPHSFPIKSSESICNSKLAYALANAGYMVDVFSCENKSTYSHDKQFNDLLSSHRNLHIYSTSYNRILNKRISLRELFVNIAYNVKIVLKTGYFYPSIPIAYSLLTLVQKHIKDTGTKYDVIITRGFDTDIVGIIISKKYHIPWIANWNDPFPNKRFPPPYGLGHNARLAHYQQKVINDIQKYASIHTFPNGRLRNYMLKCFPLVQKESTRVIPHMAHSCLIPTHTHNHDRILRLVYTGDLKPPRDPELFLRALSKTCSRFQEIDFELNIIGSYNANIVDLIRELNLTDKVQLLPSMTYSEVINFIKDCDVSVVIEAQCEEGIYLPTKVVDAFQCGKPIFCVSPFPGVLNDIITNQHVGYYTDNTSLESIVNGLSNLFTDFKQHTLPKVNESTVHEFFEKSIVDSYQMIISEICR